VICSNGSTAYINEHSLIDGDTLIQLVHNVRQAICDDKPTQNTNITHEEDITNSIKEHSFEIDLEIESHINRVTQMFYSTITPIEYTHHIYKDLNMSILRAHKCSPKPSMQILMQLASRLYFGIQYPCLEAVSLRTFYKGRPDFIQAATPSVVTFCNAICDTSSKPSTSLERRALFMEAMKDLTNVMANTSRGRYFRNHMLALRNVLKPDEDMPDFFKHLSMSLIGPGRVSLDSLEWSGFLSEAGLHRPGEMAKFWVHYEIKEDQ
jgi:hypothetical protein